MLRPLCSNIKVNVPILNDVGTKYKTCLHHGIFASFLILASFSKLSFLQASPGSRSRQNTFSLNFSPSCFPSSVPFVSIPSMLLRGLLPLPPQSLQPGWEELSSGEIEKEHILFLRPWIQPFLKQNYL